MTSIPSASGIYRITCTVNGRFYIGSAVNLYKRWYDHRFHLSRKTHRNQKLQRAWDKYGEDAFIFEVIEFVLSPFLLMREQYWLDKLNPFFNIARFAQAPLLGLTHSLETRAKMRAAKLEKEVSFESRAKMRIAKLGKPGPNLGRKLSAERRAKQSDANTSQMTTIIVIDPNGNEVLVTGICKFCREHNLQPSNLLNVAKGKAHQTKGWKARFPLNY